MRATVQDNSFPKDHLPLLKFYLYNRTFKVKIDKVVTSLFDIKAGVPDISIYSVPQIFRP